MMQPEFSVGDYVFYVHDGDIGVVVDVDHSASRRASNMHSEPYYIEWHFHPEQSGWHSAFDHSELAEQVILPLTT